ncbi:hypothetical protein ACHWQZ_G011492 [Mnemiopsis leidyi]
MTVLRFALASWIVGTVFTGSEMCYGRCFAFYEPSNDPQILLDALGYNSGASILCNENTTTSCTGDSKCTNTNLYVSVVGKHWQMGSFQCQNKTVTERELCNRLKSEAVYAGMNVYTCAVEFCFTDLCNTRWLSWDSGQTSCTLHLLVSLALTSYIFLYLV